MIKIRKETEAKIRNYAKRKGVEGPEAVAKIVDGYFARLGALAKYANKQKNLTKAGKKGKPKPKPKPAYKKTAKKPVLKRAA